jgi:hypothetical protein
MSLRVPSRPAKEPVVLVEAGEDDAGDVVGAAALHG